MSKMKKLFYEDKERYFDLGYLRYENSVISFSIFSFISWNLKSYLLPPWREPQFTCMEAVWYENCCSLLYNYFDLRFNK